jgi:hypothetical protein
MLFHEKRPEIEIDFTTSRRAARDNGSTACKAIKAFHQYVASDMFDNQIDTAAIGNFADLGRPMCVRRVENKFSPEMLREHPFGLGRTGADDARAELLCDLDGRRTHSTGTPDNENPITLPNGCAIREHVHGGAARQRQSGRGIKIQTAGKADKASSWNENFFRKTTITVDSEKLAEEALGFIAALTELAFATEEIGLDGNFITGLPVFDFGANCDDATRDLATECARELNRHGETGGFRPEIDVIQAAALDLDDNLIEAGNWIRNFSQFELSGCAVGDEL